MIFKTATAMAFIAILGGCATAQGGVPGPNGKPIFAVHGSDPGPALKKAAAICPNGYNVVGSPVVNPVNNNYDMTIECK